MNIMSIWFPTVYSPEPCSIWDFFQTSSLSLNFLNDMTTGMQFPTSGPTVIRDTSTTFDF